MPPAPRVERTVVTGFEFCVVDVVVFSDVPAPERVVDADSRARYMMNMVMANDVFYAHCYKYTGSLLAENTDMVNQVVRNLTLGRIVFGLWTEIPRPFGATEWTRPFLGSINMVFAYQADPTIADFGEFVPIDLIRRLWLLINTALPPTASKKQFKTAQSSAPSKKTDPPR